jgi:hypothetical protein
MRKLHAIGLLAALSTSKHSIAGSIVTGASAILASPMIGMDAMVWGASAFGAVISKVKFKPTTRSDTYVQGSVSVMLGGFMGPYVATAFPAILKVWIDAPVDPLPAPFCAFMLAAFWIYVAGYIKKFADKRVKDD